MIAQDQVLLIGLLASGAFILAFILWPLFRVGYQGFFTLDGIFNLDYFQRYFDAQLGPSFRRVFSDTIVMGLLTATGSTALGFLLAYTVVRCQVPFKRAIHALILLPTISPPFAIAIATILLFGRNGLVTRKILNIDFSPYGMHGLVFVQIITFFSIAYLIIRSLLERIEPSMEEAALSLGASKWHIFRTITLPLLTPGIAASFLLMFVESLADLANPLFIAGDTTVLSAQIWIAVNGEYNQHKGAALSLVLLIPTLTVFLIQYYIVARRSFIAVTGKPTGGSSATFVKEPRLRAIFIGLSTFILLFILSLYVTIFAGSITKLWGINYSLDLTHYGQVFSRGFKAIIDTTFLSAVATPIAGIAGMVIAFLVVRKKFSGKASLDFFSTLGGAVPGTILGIGYIIAFIQAPTVIVAIIYAALAYLLVSAATRVTWQRLFLFSGGTFASLALVWLTWTPEIRAAFPIQFASLAQTIPTINADEWQRDLALALGAIGIAALAFLPTETRSRQFMLLFVMGIYLVARQFVPDWAQNIVLWSRQQGGDILPRVGPSLAQYINLFFQLPLAILGFTYTALAGAISARFAARNRAIGFFIALILLSVAGALTFYGKKDIGETLALVGTPYIVLAAYAVRSLPASVRAGIAALQQIDPSIEEASTSLGGDAQYTFRKVTLPLIVPAFVAGLIFSFARHMTSLSAIIFLTTAKWPILTALILSEVEQGGMSIASR
ncbi:MAG: ABC transporter permease subunit [Chloroflexi bacterium]|nr:ABC transporter permease subunit [Chloroflexota bacterium]